MKDLRKLFGIIFVAAVIVCAMASCDFSVLGGGGGTGDSTPTTPTTPVTPTTPGSGTVTGVYLNKSSVTLLAGGTEALTASITPSNATNQNLTWTSSNTSAATVSEGGLVTAIAVGTATITVKTQDGDKTASCTVTVNPIAVSGVSLKSSTSLAVGGTETLYAVIDPPNASNQSVTWDSNNIGVATVSENGVVTAVVAGTATITVKTQDGNKTADCIVTVVTSPIAVTGVSLNKSSTSIDADNSEYLYATITPSNATNQNVTWTSSNDYAATVSASGLVTAVAVGTATITVRTQDGDKTASCTVTVNPIAVTSVSLKKDTTIDIGGTELLSPIILPSNATNQNVTWNSNNTGVATVSANGTVTAVAAGTATITVTTVDGNKTASCTVTVPAPDNAFYSIADMATWLSNQPANSAASPYNVKLNVSNLGGNYNISGSAGKALRDNPDKYVNLDLSGSTFNKIIQTNFYLCHSLIGVTIGNSVTNIEPPVFRNCVNLTAINVDATNTTYSSQDGMLYNKDKTALIGYPAGKTASSFTIPSNVIRICYSAFFSCNNLTNVTIPDGVTSIDEGAFEFCINLVTINVASGNNAFTSDNGVLYNKDKTALFRYPEGKTSSAFTIPESVTIIERYAFFGCTRLISVTFEGKIEQGKFDSESPFPGDLRDKYLAGGTGTYTRSRGSDTWTNNPTSVSGIELVFLENDNYKNFAIEARLDSTQWASVTSESGYEEALEKISKKVYEKFRDDFDFIFFILNYERITNATDPIIKQLGGLYGVNIPVSNNVKGLGIEEFSSVFYYGSAGKLKSVIYLPFHDAIKWGPSLHEIAHTWGVEICPTYGWDNTGETRWDGHWGASSAGGQLGGFKYVKEVITPSGAKEYQGSMDGTFTDGFGLTANNGNSIPYSDIELYLMGMIEADELRKKDFSLDIYRGLSNGSSGKGSFKSTYKTSYSIDDLINLKGNGPRDPDAKSSQKDFKVLTVILSDSLDIYASTRYDEIVKVVKWFAGESTINGIYNFKQATGCKGSLEVGGILNSLKP